MEEADGEPVTAARPHAICRRSSSRGRGDGDPGASAKYPGKEEALVRNVDLRIFGQHKARSLVDLSRSTDDDRRRLRSKIDAGDVNAAYVHLAEGLPSNERSRREFDELVDANLLTTATVIIHGTALSSLQLRDAKDAGAKLVWSPQSNLRLYGETTPAAEALDRGVQIGLGADWLPSGSQSLLAEQKSRDGRSNARARV